MSGLCDDDDYCITQLDVCQKEHSYWPQITDFKRLYEENPDCVFILNKRDVPSLLKSWKNWKRLDKRLYEYSPGLVKEPNDEGFAEFVKNHYESVETFFSSHKDSKFLTFDIIDDDISKLEKYIDIKGFTEMPHERKGPYSLYC